MVKKIKNCLKDVLIAAATENLDFYFLYLPWIILVVPIDVQCTMYIVN